MPRNVILSPRVSWRKGEQREVPERGKCGLDVRAQQRDLGRSLGRGWERSQGSGDLGRGCFGRRARCVGSLWCRGEKAGRPVGLDLAVEVAPQAWACLGFVLSEVAAVGASRWEGRGKGAPTARMARCVDVGSAGGSGRGTGNVGCPNGGAAGVRRRAGRARSGGQTVREGTARGVVITQEGLEHVRGWPGSTPTQ